MSEALRWWLMTSVVGLAALPMCLSLFRSLPDRGYALSKPFALLLIGYVLWIVVILGLPNSTRVIWFVLLLFVAGSAYLLWRSRDELLAFARERWWLIVAAEAIFFLAFVTAAYLRSFVPDIGGTEKPMDFMFLNALTRAESYPPPDPWLAGEDVSYYYFGYLIVSVMSRLSGVSTAIGFNLGLAMIAGLAVTATFGLVYNLAAPKGEQEAAGGPGTPAARFSRRVLWRPIVFGVVGALLLAVMGNLEGLLEALASHNFGSSGFWEWIGINDLFAYESARWYPDQFWFWWKATRIIQPSEGLLGIHEFPFFSFLLGDLHPHVMSIPFVLLAVGVAFALLRSDTPLDVVVWLERPLWLVAIGLILGGLAFLNTWDMPTLAFVIALITVLRNRLLADRWSWGLLLDSAGFLAPLFLVSFLAYTPFFFGGFDSQAAGFTAAALEGSCLFHILLLWGAFAVLVLPYAAWRIARSREPITASALWSLAPFVAVLLLWVVWDAFGASAEQITNDTAGFTRHSLLGWLPDGIRPNDGQVGIPDRIGDRGWSGWFSILAIGGSLSLLTFALSRELGAAKREGGERLSHVMALALSATAALLILGAELIFIQDGFNSRMNTIFKLYYQAWLMLSVAGGFVLFELAGSLTLPRPAAREEPAAPRRSSAWSLGEYAVSAATLAGGITGIVILARSNADADFLTVVLSLLMGSGLFFVLSGALLLLWRSSARDFVTGVTAAGIIAGMAIFGFLVGDSLGAVLLGAFVGAIASLALGFAAIRLGSVIPHSEERAPGSRALSWHAVWAGGAIVILASAFVYPLLATWNRTEGCVGHPVRLLEGPADCGQVFANRSLDGLVRVDPDEREAIEFLRELDGQPVIAEALGDDYTDGGRISASTGLPTLLQWPGHELQWRGTAEPQAGRPEALETLYTSEDMTQLTDIIEEYDISYVYLGQRERQKHPALALPEELFEPAFENGSVIIYRVRPGIRGEVARE